MNADPLQVTIVTGASGDHEDDSKCDAAATAPPSIECTQNYGGCMHMHDGALAC